MTAIEKNTESEVNFIQKMYNNVGDFLDKHPTVYKVVLVGCHFFRTLAMFGAMVYLPLPMLATATIMVGGSLIYRAAVERFCCFRFTIESLVGAASAWLAMIGTINFISGAALASVGLIIANSLALLPVLGYMAWVIYLSHTDIENRMKTIGADNSNKEITLQGTCPCN